MQLAAQTRQQSDLFGPRPETDPTLLRPDMRRQITALGLEGTKGWRGRSQVVKLLNSYVEGVDDKGPVSLLIVTDSTFRDAFIEGNGGNRGKHATGDLNVATSICQHLKVAAGGKGRVSISDKWQKC